MESNPYQTPNADLGNSSINKRSIWWKIYFFVITILSALGFMALIPLPTTGYAEYINFILWLPATIGLYGFTFNTHFLKSKRWLHFLIIYFLYGVIYHYISNIDLRMGMDDLGYYLTNVFGWLISIPGYYALYLFSKPVKETVK